MIVWDSPSIEMRRSFWSKTTLDGKSFEARSITLHRLSLPFTTIVFWDRYIVNRINSNLISRDVSDTICFLTSHLGVGVWSYIGVGVKLLSHNVSGITSQLWPFFSIDVSDFHVVGRLMLGLGSTNIFFLWSSHIYFLTGFHLLSYYSVEFYWRLFGRSRIVLLYLLWWGREYYTHVHSVSLFSYRIWFCLTTTFWCRSSTAQEHLSNCCLVMWQQYNSVGMEVLQPHILLRPRFYNMYIRTRVYCKCNRMFYSRMSQRRTRDMGGSSVVFYKERHLQHNGQKKKREAFLANRREGSFFVLRMIDERSSYMGLLHAGGGLPWQQRIA